jgi:hypothetical protein
MGNDDLKQFANKESQKLKDELKPNLPSGEDLKKKAAVMGTIGVIASFIKNGFKMPKKLKPIPVGLVLSGARFREGLSSIDIASRIIERKKEIGIDIGPLPSGAKNIDLQMEVIRIEEIIDAMIKNCQVVIEIPPGIQLTAAPIGPGSPVVGATTQQLQVLGVLR